MKESNKGMKRLQLTILKNLGVKKTWEHEIKNVLEQTIECLILLFYTTFYTFIYSSKRARYYMKIYKFDELAEAPLVIDAIYEGGSYGNTRDEPLPKLIPNLENMGGFRKTRRLSSENWAYVVLYTTGNETEWPDLFDTETGIFRYYGDNRKPGNTLHETPKGGNKLLADIFRTVYEGPEARKKLPAILVFQKRITDNSKRSVRFLGLAVPGNPSINPDEALVAIWRTKKGERFQNYEAYFTILDTGIEPISKEWLNALRMNQENLLELAPKVWRDFIKKGLTAVKPLKAPKIKTYRTKIEQLPTKKIKKQILEKIYEHYKENPIGFEKFAVKIVQLMDKNFIEFDLTRPWKDGGRDAIGKYRIGHLNEKLIIDCALEAKLFSPETGVRVKHTSRLISRIKHRQFGVFVTTSYIAQQAYEEIQEDQHPILIISGIDIADILFTNHINIENIDSILEEN
ncbi:restriction endonuclease [Bacillus sp. JJ1533]|uniref:restriction endonuclease n=1 Tax=Bacillus sp. JJ1533 TaxID=3122959 RepID=UPI002FFE2ADD